MLPSPLLRNRSGYLDGQWCFADSGETMPVINPATGGAIAEVPVMGRAETTRAVKSAAGALSNPAAVEQRKSWLGRLADLVSANRQELGRIITHGHGKPWQEAQGEVDYAASFF